MSGVRLRRGVAARFASSTPQFVLSLICGFVLVGLAFAIAQGHSIAGLGWLFWIWLTPFVLLWVGGATAWARVDDQGIRWRYWIKQDFPWDRVTRVTLTKRALVAQPAAFGRSLTIVVHGRTSHNSTAEVNIRPAEFTSRQLRRFATEVVTRAQQHGVRVDVASRGWDQPMPEGAPEKTWS